MPESEPHSSDPPAQNSPASLISREIVQLHKRHFGRGPTKCKTYLDKDAVFVLMSDGHTTSEETLDEAGLARSVAQSRVDISEAARQDFIDAVERHTGRKVVGFMSSSQQQPSLLSHVYVFEANDLLQAVE